MTPLRTTPGEISLVRNLPFHIPVTVWYEALRELPMAVLLSSGSATHAAGRFDIITADPSLKLGTRDGQTEITEADTGKLYSFKQAPFELLQQCCPVAASEDPQVRDLPFTGGAIGYFSYELLHQSYKLPRNKALDGAPADMLAGIYDWALIIDQAKNCTTLVLRNMPSAREQRILQIIDHVIEHHDRAFAANPFRLTAPFSSNFTRAAYLERFNRVIEYIKAGDCYQVNLAQCFSAPCSGDPFEAFSRLQSKADAPFAAYIEDDTTAVMSFSPERFLQVCNGKVITQPIKGTRPRAEDSREDRANRDALANSSKDRAENLMIVDLLRNDIGRICDVGSVKAETMFEIQTFTNVHHLVSTISGRLGNLEDVFRLFSACFPGGSITGTPKQRAMEIIDELETMPRSVYCGAIAWFGYNGNMDSNICIRTLVKAGNSVYCWGGGGIVADSTGDSEYQETLDKIGIFINNL